MSVRTVKVFIASSDELVNERKIFDSLFGSLNSVFKIRGVQLESVKWEQLDSSQGPTKKQEEYNREIKNCDICVVMFWREFGDFTKEELDVANTELCAGRKPHKVYVFFKETGKISKELKEFKKNYSKQYGHYYNKFTSTDQLQLDFTLQLERFLHSNLVRVDNSEIKIDDTVIAHLDNINFAANNDKYKSLREDINKLAKVISSLDGISKTDQTIESLLNTTKQELYIKQNELHLHEKLLLGAAVRVAQLVDKRVSDRTQRATALFEQGKVNEACTILDEAENDANKILEGINNLQQTGKQSIEELVLKAHYTLVNTKDPIEDRVKKSGELYETACQLAEKVDYEKEKYDNLLYEYGAFLGTFAKYNKAEDIYKRVISLREEIYGDKDIRTASAYDCLGEIYFHAHNIDSAFHFCNQALKINKKILGKKHPKTAESYRNIGRIYNERADFDKALEYLNNSIAIYNKLGWENPKVATSHHNLATTYLYRYEKRKNKTDLEEAIKSFRNAIQIHNKTKEGSFSDRVDIFYCLGHLFTVVKSYDKAIEEYLQALDIIKKALGSRHILIADTYTNLGNVYAKKGDYNNSIEHFHKALEIVIEVFGSESLKTADLYHRLCITYLTQKDIDNASKYFNKVLQIYSDKEILLDFKYIETMCMIASTYKDSGDLYSAERYLKLAKSHLCSQQRQNKSNTKE